MDELEFYNGQMTGQEIDYRIIIVNCGTVSSLPHTVESDKVTAKHVVLNWWVNNPQAMAGNWIYTTANGSITISGDFAPYGTTNLTLTLGIPGEIRRHKNGKRNLRGQRKNR